MKAVWATLLLCSSLAGAEKLPNVGYVYVGATWCAPCRVAKQNVLVPLKEAGWTVIELDVDTNWQQVDNMGVDKIPCWIAVKRGKLAERYVGTELSGALKLFNLKPIRR